MPDIRIRWSDNTEQLAQHLKAGLNQIEATRAGVEKMVQSFQGEKLIAAAHRYTAAVAQTGGATKLTAAEQARVNDLLTRAIEKYTLLGKVAPDAMVKLAAETSKAAKVTEVDMAAAMGAVGKKALDNQKLLTGMGQAGRDAMKGVATEAAKTNTVMGTLGVGVKGVATSIATTAAGFLSAQAILGAVTGAVDALSAAIQKLAMEGAVIADVSASFDRLTAAVGLTGSTLLANLREGTRRTIEDFELIKVVNQDLAAGMVLTEQQFGTLAKGAYALAQTTGTDVKTAFDAMNEAMLTGQTRGIKSLTGVIDLQKAEERLARAMGGTREQLDAEGKVQAAREAILERVTEIVERLGEQTEGLDTKVQQLTTTWRNFVNDLAKSVGTSNVLNAGLGVLEESLTKAFGGDREAAIRGITRAIEDTAIKLVELAQVGVKGGALLIEKYVDVYELFVDLGNLIDRIAVAAKFVAKGPIFTPGEVAEFTKEMQEANARVEERNALMAEMRAKAGGGIEFVSNALDKLHRGMVEARADQVAFVGPLEVTSQGFRKQVGALNADTAALKKNAEAWRQYNSVRTSVHDQLSGETIEGIKYDLQRSVSQGVIAEVYGVTAEQVAALADELKTLKEFEGLDRNDIDELFKLGRKPVGGTMFTDELGKSLLRTRDEVERLEHDLDHIAQLGIQIKPHIDDLRLTVQGTLVSTFKDLPKFLIQGFTGGGGWKGALQALGTNFGQDLFNEKTGPFGNAVKAAQVKLPKIFGSTIGSSLAAAIPSIGALIGPAIAGLTKMFGKIFGGPSEQELAGRAVKAKFQESFGGFEQMLQRISAAYTETGRTAEDARLEVERLMKAEKEGGEAVEAVITDINKVLKEQAVRWEAVGEAAGDLNAFVADGITDQGRYNIAARSAVAIFDAWVAKTGDVMGALEQIGPALDEIDFVGQMRRIDAERQKLFDAGTREGPEIDKLDEQWDAAKRKYEEFGKAGGAAIDQLLQMRRVTEQFPELTNQIGMSTRLIDSLGRAGLLNQDLLIAFGQNAVNQFTQLKAATGDSKLAMVMMQPELQKLWEHQQKFGEFADVATRELIEQAKEQGLVGPQMRSSQEQLLEVMKDIRDVLAEATGNAERFGQRLRDVPDRTINVDVNYNDPGPPTPEQQEYEETGFASRGGLVMRHGIQHFDRGGMVQTARQMLVPALHLASGSHGTVGAVFTPRGTDTVPAMLTPGEEVTSTADRSTFLQGLASLQTEIRTLVAELATPRPIVMMADAREIARGQVRVIDTGGALRTEFRDALGVT